MHKPKEAPSDAILPRFARGYRAPLPRSVRDIRAVDQQVESKPLLVISADGKGIVMRKDDLREATRKAATSSRRKRA